MEVAVKAYKITNKHKNRIRQKKSTDKMENGKITENIIKRTSTVPCERLKYE